MAELPPPIAQGDLSRTPFAHALLYCYQRGLNGTLVIWPEDPEQTPGQDRIYFAGGVPVSARLLRPAGALDRGLLPLFSRRSGAYAFYGDLDLVGTGELVRSGRVDPLTLIAASLRGPTRDDVVEQVLAAFEGGPVRLKPGVFDPKRLDLLPKEQVFFDVIRAGPATIEELVSQCEMGAQLGKRFLYLLAITKALEPYIAQEATAPGPGPVLSSQPLATGASEPALPGGETPLASQAGGLRSPRPTRRQLDPEPPPPPPAGLSSEHAALWAEIAERAVEIERQNYFEMLGIDRSAGSDTVRKTYLGLVKKWHPDRIPPELAPLKPWVERIFHHLTAAHDTLVDDDRRGPYLKNVQDGGGTPEADRKLAAILQAAMDQQKAEVLMRRRDYKEAAELLRGATEPNPNDAHAFASLAWALYQLPTTPEREIEMTSAIEHAVTLQPESDRVRYYRGMILRRAGRETEALADFEKAAAINPKNIEAAREVRLAKMRAQTGPPAKPGEGSKPKQAGAGILAKLFGTPKKDPKTEGK